VRRPTRAADDRPRARRRPAPPTGDEPMTSNSFGTRSELAVGDRRFEIERLDRLEVDLDSLPYALKILLENLVRNEDGAAITADDVTAFLGHDPAGGGQIETLFTPARVLLQDFTGVPAIVDFAAMRDASPSVAATRRSSSQDRRGPRHRPLGHRRGRRDPKAFDPQRRDRVQPQPRALPVHPLGCGGVQRPARSSRRAPASSTRSTSSTSRRSSTPTTRAAPTRTRSSASTATPR
jgi:hypothetical protein